MKRSWTATAVMLIALGIVAGCNDYNNTVQYNTGATITNISPSALLAGTPSGTLPNCPNTPTGRTNPCFQLFVIGSITNGFQSNTLVEWSQNKLPVCTNANGAGNPQATNGCSTYIDSTDMTAYIPYSFVAKPGSVYVNTYTPQSGTGNNGLSNALTFTIYGNPNPYPLISSISPTSASYCAYSSNATCASVALTVNGSNFLKGSQNSGSSVTFTSQPATNGVETAITVTSISSTKITATIPGAYLCAVGTAQINVINPPSAICIINCPNLGGGDTNNPPTGQPATTQIFTINGTAGTSTCPPPTPPNPNPTVVEETPSVSQDGRFVTYAARQDGNSNTQILLRDTCIGAKTECTPSTQVISVNAENAVGNGDSHDAVMTSDGRYIAFSSAATNLISNAPAGRQVYFRDTCQGATTTCKPLTQLVSIDEEGKLAGSEAILPSISTSGRFVAFLAVTPGHTPSASSKGSNAANSTSNSGLRQVFIRDSCLGATNCTPTTTRISLQPGDTTPGTSKPAGPALAGLARQIALSDSKNSTVFTPTVPIDDQVFLAIRDAKQ
jgi:WD40-like Beta Propeller Repeat